MNSSAAGLSPKDSSDFMVIMRAGLTCGVMDITAAVVVYGLVYGVRPIQLLQGIASGLLGQQAYRGGTATALMGLWLHFIIAFSVAAAYFVQSQKIPFLLGAR